MLRYAIKMASGEIVFADYSKGDIIELDHGYENILLPAGETVRAALARAFPNAEIYCLANKK